MSWSLLQAIRLIALGDEMYELLGEQTGNNDRHDLGHDVEHEAADDVLNGFWKQ